MRIRVLLLSTVVLICAAVGSARQENAAIDLTGTWVFSVDLDSGAHGDPTFVFKQDKDKLTGSYDGPLGKREVTGTIKDNKAVFGFEFTQDSTTVRATYTGTVESNTKMSGTLEFTGGQKGKWTATKK